MKKILGFLMLAPTISMVVSTTTAWAQGAPSYNFNAVAGTATAAISRVGQVEHDLADAKTEVASLKTDLATLKASRGASAGALRRANEALAEAESKAAYLQKRLEVTAANDEAGQKRLETLMTGKPAEWNYLLPTEDPLVGLVRQKCPEGTTPELVVFGTNRRFECKPLIKAADLTVPAKERTMPLWAKYSLFIVGGAATGVAGNYAINTLDNREDTAASYTFGAIGGAVVGGVICALTEL